MNQRFYGKICKCKSKLDGRKCNSNQKWSNKKSQCEDFSKYHG